MTTRRGFFAALAGLLAVPKVALAVPKVALAAPARVFQRSTRALAPQDVLDRYMQPAVDAIAKSINADLFRLYPLLSGMDETELSALPVSAPECIWEDEDFDYL